MNKYNLIIVFVLLCTSFSVHAESGKEIDKNTSDNRILLEVPYKDRDDLMRVMRANLKNLGKMIDAMINDDFKSVQLIAENMSFNKKKGKGLSSRGNPSFAAMGVQFHAVDTIAVKKAAEVKDRKATLHAISNMVNTCVDCHSTFKVVEWPDNKIYKRPESTQLVLPKGYKITN